jgi:hypothetical protein
MMFKAPADFEIPEGTKEGDSFDAMATFVLKPGGMLGLQSVEGSPVGGDDEMEDEMEDEGEGEETGEMEEKPKRERQGMAPGFLIAIERGMSKKK